MRVRYKRRLQVETLETRNTPGAFVGGLVGVASAPLDAMQSHKINTHGHGQITSFDQTTGRVSTSGVIDGGLLRGATQFSAQIIDQQGNYVGATTITTKHGDVYLQDTGTLNANGLFTDHATITGGTVRFKGALGHLIFQGHELSDGVQFVDDHIKGSVSLPQSFPIG